MEGQMTFEFDKRPTIKGYQSLDGRESVPMSLHNIIRLSFVKDMVRKLTAG